MVSSKQYGPLKVDIAYGGNVYAILPIESVGLSVDASKTSEIIAAGNSIKNEINNQIKVSHPLITFENHVTHVEFYERADRKDLIRNAVVIPPGAIDRSPCGTGTSAKLSVLASKGEIKKGEVFIHESITGSRFVCKYLDDAKVGELDAVVPQVTGRAWVTGLNTFILEPDDIFPEGFQLGI